MKIFTSLCLCAFASSTLLAASASAFQGSPKAVPTPAKSANAKVDPPAPAPPVASPKPADQVKPVEPAKPSAQVKPAAPAEPVKPAKQEAKEVAPVPAKHATAREANGACELKAGTGVENRQVQGESASFKAGDKVWVWSKVSGQADQMVSHVWKKDGQIVRTAKLPIKHALYTTNSRASPPVGSYVVECVDAQGKVLGSVAFSVTKS